MAGVKGTETPTSQFSADNVTTIGIAALPKIANIPATPGVLLKYRSDLMGFAGEFFGTMVLVILGTGVNCQVGLSASTNVTSNPKGDWTSLSLGWATAVAIGVWVSGGHINPAVTLAQATWRSFPWRKVPGYIICQVLGALVGAAITYGNYVHAIDAFEGGARTLKTAGLFATYPLPYMTSAACFFSEFLATSMLVLGALALSDRKRTPIPSSLVPVGIWLLVLGIATSLGMQTGFALNPARDLGPRILTAMVGYGGQVFSTRSHYWIWTPILAPLLGAQVATIAYDLFLHSDEDESTRVHQLLKKADKALQSKPAISADSIV